MNKKFNFLVVLVSLLALGLVFVSCDNGTSPGGGGTFRIRITNIPSEIMSAGQSGQILIGLYPANSTTYTISNALAGRDTSLAVAADFCSDWYEFSMYNTSTLEEYVDSAGNYDIGFISGQTSRVLKNVRLKVNQLNTFSYSDFTNH
jgi:hypothetical protein